MIDTYTERKSAVWNTNNTFSGQKINRLIWRVGEGIVLKNLSQNQPHLTLNLSLIYILLSSSGALAIILITPLYVFPLLLNCLSGPFQNWPQWKTLKSINQHPFAFRNKSEKTNATTLRKWNLHKSEPNSQIICFDLVSFPHCTQHALLVIIAFHSFIGCGTFFQPNLN